MAPITPQNTGIVLAHGAWHTPWHYEPLTKGLEEKGYQVLSPQLPSVTPQRAGLEGDAAVVRSEIEKLFASGKDAVILMHSYGGNVGNEASKDLQKPADGSKPGVVRLVYLCAFAVPVGKSVISHDNGRSDWIQPNFETGWATSSRQKEVFYNDIQDQGLVDSFIEKLGPHDIAALAGNTTWEAYREIPAAYVLCEKDMAIKADFQAEMAGEAGIAKVVKVDASHTPFVAKREETVNAVLEAMADI